MLPLEEKGQKYGATLKQQAKYEESKRKRQEIMLSYLTASVSRIFEQALRVAPEGTTLVFCEVEAVHERRIVYKVSAQSGTDEPEVLGHESLQLPRRYDIGKWDGDKSAPTISFSYTPFLGAILDFELKFSLPCKEISFWLSQSFSPLCSLHGGWLFLF